MKRRINLTEADLHRIVRKSLNKVLMESSWVERMDDKVEQIRQFGDDNVSELSNRELSDRFNYMLNYQWALEGQEWIMDYYYEEIKERTKEGRYEY